MTRARPVPKSAPRSRPGDGPIARGELIVEFVRAHLHVLRQYDPWDGTSTAAPATAAIESIDSLFGAMMANEVAHPWLHFVRVIDTVARTGRTADVAPPADFLAHDAMRMFGRLFPEHVARLKVDKVTRAIEAWRGQQPLGRGTRHWKAVREAVADFFPDAPEARSMSRLWSAFPHNKFPQHAAPTRT